MNPFILTFIVLFSRYLDLVLYHKLRLKRDYYTLLEKKGLSYPAHFTTSREASRLIDGLYNATFRVNLTLDGRQALLKLTRGDMRRALNVIQVSVFSDSQQKYEISC